MAKAYWVVCYLSVTEPKHGKSRGVGAAGSFQAQGRGSRSIPFEPKQTAASPQCLYAFAAGEATKAREVEEESCCARTTSARRRPRAASGVAGGAFCRR
jgi:hypothetical protein